MLLAPPSSMASMTACARYLANPSRGMNGKRRQPAVWSLAPQLARPIGFAGLMVGVQCSCHGRHGASEYISPAAGGPTPERYLGQGQPRVARSVAILREHSERP